MFELTVKTHFAAAHQLTMVSQKCENLHGHNWKIEVSITGEKLDSKGILLDFGVIKAHIKNIIKDLDHKHLNDMPCFEGNPSSERISVEIANRLKELIEDKNVRVSRVSAWESDNACATYFPD
ncbi:MAG: 6-carboxytetrahydropterin synthase QueD [Desulfobacteraceae bacterium]|nr:6-carboxytetrahydropterin synthase QueD [Desulfobacteraceae bacterium]